MISWYVIGLVVIFAGVALTFSAFLKERDDVHKLILADLAEIAGLAIIALTATDLAEALIIPGLVVGISELLAVSEIYLTREKLFVQPAKSFRMEVMDTAPAILGAILVIFGIVLSGFTGGAVAATGVIFYFLCKGQQERFALIETVSGYAWALWIAAFFTFMLAPSYWFFGVMMAGSAILAKVVAKMSLIGAMRGESNA